MIDVAVSYDVADMCGVTKTLTVTSNEPDTSPERGDLAGDWEVVSSNLVRLRAERLGNGTGRIYTITINVSDGVNTSTQTVTVSVPHDQGRN